MSKYGVFSGPYFPLFSPNTGKYGPEKTPYLDTFHAAITYRSLSSPINNEQDDDTSYNRISGASLKKNQAKEKRYCSFSFSNNI